MSIDRVLIALMLISPDLLQQRQPENTSRDGGQSNTAARIRAGEVHHLAAQPHFAGQRIDAQTMAGQAPGVHQQVLPHRLGDETAL